MPETSPLQELLTEQEVADLFKMSTRSVRRLRLNGDLPFVRVGPSARYLASDIAAWIESQKGSAA